MTFGNNNLNSANYNYKMVNHTITKANDNYSCVKIEVGQIYLRS